MKILITSPHALHFGESSHRTPCNRAYHRQRCRISQMQPLSARLIGWYIFVETPRKMQYLRDACLVIR